MKTIAELTAKREAMQPHMAVRLGFASLNKEDYSRHVLICTGTGCTSSKSLKIAEALEAALKENGLEKDVQIVKTGCFGLCALGPIMIVYPEGTFYSRVEVEDVPEIVEKHLVNNQIVSRLVYSDSTEPIPEGTSVALSDTIFYKKQNRVSLRNCGLIDPECIDEYIAMDGYKALGTVLTTMTPDDVIKILLDSGLRGRGGGGFPTGMKWSFAKKSVSDKKYVVCNADEGDPGAFMDRSVLEGDPHAVIEAMAIAGFAIGADEGYVYVRAEYPIAVRRLKIAIEQARAEGILGKNIFSTGFNFDIQVRLGAGAFVCGEETALLTSIEGNRGEPRPRPPFPAVKGLFGQPTIINNVETYANIPQIINKGAAWFAGMGTEKSKGTKVFALSGKIEHTGLVEIPMGTTLRDIVYEIGGGVPNGKKFKAAQMGGPSGGCVPASLIDTCIDYDSLIAVGAMIGSGGLIVLDEDNCMVDIAKFFLEFTVDESCGKCTPCRVGIRKMLDILTRITEGKGEDGDIEKLEELAMMVKTNSLCGLGQTAPNPVLSTLRYFRDEYEAHIYEKRCPAGACKTLTSFHIDTDKCVGCGLCAKNCPVGAITRLDANDFPGKKLAPFTIDTKTCIKCGVCLGNCKKFKAIYKK
ncbi:MAG: NADH-quinone oxidoreductase subunit NuoF [Clostridia bacterium]|nr:NADH-quinone oxidoreductase subunit NuoF [Clostridia bacterium]